MLNKWDVEDIDLLVEKQIITGMIVSDSFMRKVRKIFNIEFLQSEYCKIVSRWCVDYFDEFNKTPGKFIQDIFMVRSLQLESSLMETVSIFLTNLSNSFVENEDLGRQYESDYLLKKAENYLQLRAVTLKLEKATSLLHQNKIDQILTELATISDVKLNTSSSIEPLVDDDLFIKALTNKQEVLFKLDGALGDFIGPLYRKYFFAIAGPAKRGKSYFMNEIIIQAVMKGLNVAYFSMGDMFDEEITLRVTQRITTRPLDAGVYRFPVKDCTYNQANLCTKPERTNLIKLLNEKGEKPVFGEHNKKYKVCSACTDRMKPTYWFVEKKLPALDIFNGIQTRKKFLRQYKGRYKAECWGRGQATISDVIAKLDTWELFDNFIADIVITDYADVMASDDYQREERHKLNSIWMAHDALAKNRDVLLITGTHTIKSTLTKDIEQSDITEDSRKMHHVNTCVALNQTDEEERDGIMRVGYLFARGERRTRNKACVLLQQLSVGQFCLDSYLI